jgi:glycosyltransferase involved in cell wall biosynthesis
MGHDVAAIDLIKALNEHTDIESVALSLQQPTSQPGGVSVRYPDVGESSSRLSRERLKWFKNTISEFDVITTYHTLAGAVGAVFAKAQRVRIVAREGNDHTRFPLKVRVARTITGLLADRIVCVSQSVADSYRGFERMIPNSKFTVIQNCVDVTAVQQADEFDWSIYDTAPVASEAFVVGTVGMLIEQKNHETLIRSVADLIHERSMDVELVIAGSGPQWGVLRELATDLNVNDHVHFLGYLEREQVYKMLHEIDCYAMPSMWEGFSAAALQAMAAGVPCVLSDIPSFSTQYPSSVAQFHSPESDTELANALFETLTTDSIRGEKGYEFVCKNHSSDRMAERYKKIYLDETK